MAFFGDYTSQPLTDKQVRSARLLIQSLEKIYDINSVRTHGDWDPVKATNCAVCGRSCKAY